MLDKNTPGKPQKSHPSPKNRTQKTRNVMSTRNVTPQPSGGGKSTRKQQTNTNAHISLVLQEVAAKLTRRLSEDEMAIIWDAATKFDHQMTAEEALAVLEVGVEEFTGKRQRKVKLTAEKVTKDVARLLERELTTGEKLQISDSLADAEPVTRSEYEDHVSEVAAHYRNVEQEEASRPKPSPMPPILQWNDGRRRQPNLAPISVFGSERLRRWSRKLNKRGKISPP